MVENSETEYCCSEHFGVGQVMGLLFPVGCIPGSLNVKLQNITEDASDLVERARGHGGGKQVAMSGYVRPLSQVQSAGAFSYSTPSALDTLSWSLPGVLLHRVERSTVARCNSDPLSDIMIGP